MGSVSGTWGVKIRLTSLYTPWSDYKHNAERRTVINKPKLFRARSSEIDHELVDCFGGVDAARFLLLLRWPGFEIQLRGT